MEFIHSGFGPLLFTTSGMFTHMSSCQCEDIVTFWSKKRSTLSTEEVLGMPRPIQGRHHFLNTQTHTAVTVAGSSLQDTAGGSTQRASGTHVQNGPVAVVAAWREQVVVVLLAVRLAVALKEVSGADLLLAVSAHEVFGVPRPAHGGHHLHTQDIKVLKNTKRKSLQLSVYNWTVKKPSEAHNSDLHRRSGVTREH